MSIAQTAIEQSAFRLRFSPNFAFSVHFCPSPCTKSHWCRPHLFGPVLTFFLLPLILLFFLSFATNCIQSSSNLVCIIIRWAQTKLLMFIYRASLGCNWLSDFLNLILLYHRSNAYHKTSATVWDDKTVFCRKETIICCENDMIWGLIITTENVNGIFWYNLKGSGPI